MALPEMTSGISLRTSKRAIVALPSGKWKKYFSASSLGMASRFIPFPGVGSSFSPSKPGRSNPQASCAETASIPTPNSPCGSAWYILMMSVVNAGDVFQKVGIADARQFGFLLV